MHEPTNLCETIATISNSYKTTGKNINHFNFPYNSLPVRSNNLQSSQILFILRHIKSISVSEIHLELINIFISRGPSIKYVIRNIAINPTALHTNYQTSFRPSFVVKVIVLIVQMYQTSSTAIKIELLMTTLKRPLNLRPKTRFLLNIGVPIKMVTTFKVGSVCCQKMALVRGARASI